MTFRNRLIYIFSFFLFSVVMISLVNLAAECLLYLRSNKIDGGVLLKSIRISFDHNHKFMSDHADDLLEGYRNIHYSPSIGVVRNFSNAQTFKGTNEGRRVTNSSTLSNKKYNGIMLGASQSWGYFVEDEFIVSQQIMSKLEDVGVDNYSLQGATLEQITRYWNHIDQSRVGYDFVLIIGGALDFFSYCYLEPTDYAIKNKLNSNFGLIKLYDFLNDKRKFNSFESPCSSPDIADRVVQRVINDITTLFYLARERNVKLLLIIPPTPFYGSSNVSNLASDISFQINQKTLTPLYKKLDQKLKLLNLVNVVNLMHSFEGQKIYFLDANAHFTPAGHEKLAVEIIKNSDSFFEFAQK